MTEGTFDYGMNILEIVFSGCKFNREIYWKTFEKTIDDKSFQFAIEQTIKTVTHADGLLAIKIMRFAMSCPDDFKPSKIWREY